MPETGGHTLGGESLSKEEARRLRVAKLNTAPAPSPSKKEGEGEEPTPMETNQEDAMQVEDSKPAADDDFPEVYTARGKKTDTYLRN